MHLETAIVFQCKKDCILEGYGKQTLILECAGLFFASPPVLQGLALNMRLLRTETDRCLLLARIR